MRVIALFVTTLAWCGSALAQTPVEDGFGPYRFGMSLEAIQATAPRASWVIEDASYGRVVSGGPQVVLADARFSAVLLLQQDVLKRVVLRGAVAGPCAAPVGELVYQLEPLYGPFHSTPAPLESGLTSQVRRTEDGSEIRTLDDVTTGRSVHTTRRRAQMFVHISGEEHMFDGAPRCRVSVAFDSRLATIANEDRNLFDQLERAETANGVEVLALPGSAGAHYPVQALASGAQGEVALDCLILAGARLHCMVAHEAPANLGFGTVALTMALDFRTNIDGANAGLVGKRLRNRISFRLPD